MTTQGATIDRDADAAKGDYALTLGRGLKILSCFTPVRTVLDVYSISNELEISRPTTHRFVGTLERAGYPVRDKSPEGSRAHKYRLGLRVLDLGTATISGTPMSVHARPILQALASTTGHRVSVGVLAGSSVLIAESTAASREHSDPSEAQRAICDFLLASESPSA
jgi:IclR family transcriptional regulator, pca regulon regulatory protein